MGETTNTIRSALLKGLLSPWVALAFIVGFGCGYIIKSLVG